MIAKSPKAKVCLLLLYENTLTLGQAACSLLGLWWRGLGPGLLGAAGPCGWHWLGPGVALVPSCMMGIALETWAGPENC